MVCVCSGKSAPSWPPLVLLSGFLSFILLFTQLQLLNIAIVNLCASTAHFCLCRALHCSSFLHLNHITKGIYMWCIGYERFQLISSIGLLLPPFKCQLKLESEKPKLHASCEHVFRILFILSFYKQKPYRPLQRYSKFSRSECWFSLAQFQCSFSAFFISSSK